MVRINKIGALVMVLIMALVLDVAGQSKVNDQNNGQKNLNSRSVLDQPNNQNDKGYPDQNNVTGGYYITRSNMKEENTKLTDAEVAATMIAVNQTDIKYAKLAKSKSKNADVLNIADTMINSHQMIIDQTNALTKKLNIVPRDNPLTTQMNIDGEATRKSLKKMSDDAFDKAYVENEIKTHESVINMVQNQLIPQTQNSELKTLLQQAIPILKAHLDEARTIQKKLM